MPLAAAEIVDQTGKYRSHGPASPPHSATPQRPHVDDIKQCDGSCVAPYVLGKQKNVQYPTNIVIWVFPSTLLTRLIPPSGETDGLAPDVIRTLLIDLACHPQLGRGPQKLNPWFFP